MKTFKILFLLCLLSCSAVHAQIGATKEQVDARHLKGDFAFTYWLSPDGHVVFEEWYCESYHSANVVLNQIEPAYTWKVERGSNWNWFGTAPGKPPLHALYWHFSNPQQSFAYHLVIASVADSPKNLWDYVMGAGKDSP
jgi:hypothetical protein